MCSEFREKERKNINHLGELPWKQMLFFSSTLSIASLAASCGKTYIESSYESGICTKSPRVLYWSSVKASSISLCQNESSFDVTSPSTTKLTGSKTTTQLTKLPMFLGDLLQPKQLSCINKQIIDKIAVFLSIFCSTRFLSLDSHDNQRRQWHLLWQHHLLRPVDGAEFLTLLNSKTNKNKGTVSLLV